MVNPNAPLVPPQLRGMLQKELNPMERITDLFSGRDDRQDMEIMLLYNILMALVGEVPAPGVPAPSGMLVNVPLQITSVDLMKNIAALTTDEINPQAMADCRQAIRMLIVVNNNFNQQISVKIIGNISGNSSGAMVIHTMNVAAGTKGSYGLKSEEWFPWIGVTVTPAANPTAGTVSAVAVLMVQGSPNQ